MLALLGMNGAVAAPGQKQNADNPIAEQHRRLVSKAEQEGDVPVLIYLNARANSVKDRPIPITKQEQRAKLYSVQQRLVEKMTAFSPRNVKSFRYLPFVAMRLNAAGLKRALSDPEVLQVQEDQLSGASLAESGPLVEATAAWAQGYTGSGQAVAVLDTGVDSGHEFLAGKVVHEACFSTTNASYGSTTICPDGNESQIGAGAGEPCADYCDHGTHVAGIAAGKGASYSGVAKDADIIAVQIFSLFPPSYCGGSSSCVLSYSSDQLAALEHIYDQRTNYNIAAINMSLGGGYYTAACDSDFRKAAIDLLASAGIATVIASGNNGYTDGISAPACISSAVSVGSTTEADAVSYFSNSASMLDLLAPGSSITSSVPGGGYATWNGTSMATPHVAGAYALLRSKTQTATSAELLAALEATGLPVTDSRNSITKPRIRVNSALNALSNFDNGLAVTPLAGIAFSGVAGGSFAPAISTYTLTNNGSASIDFSVTEAAAWLIVSPASGTLAPGGTQDVEVTLDNSAQSLGVGTYSADISFSNDTDGIGSTSRAATLSVAPQNDMFAGALDIATVPASIAASNVNATLESGEPQHAGVSGGSSVWWRFTAPQDMGIVVDTFGSDFDTTLGIYTGSDVAGLTVIAQNDDEPGGSSYQSLAAFVAQAGVTYYIAVDGYYGDSGTVVLSLSQHDIPDNDLFVNATVIDTLPASITATNQYASIESGEPDHGEAYGGSSVWWRFTPDQDMELVVDTFDSDFDTTLGVYVGSQVNALTSIAQNDDDIDAPDGLQSKVRFFAQAGTTYHIAVDGWFGEYGAIGLNLTPAMPNVELGTVEANHEWSSVLVDPAFDEAVIILSPPTFHGSHPGVARVRRQSSPDRFEVRFQEWDYLDGKHAVEQFSYLLLERGRFVLDDSTVVEVGTFNQGGTGSWVNNDFISSFDGAPKVFLTLQTNNGSQAVTARVRNVTANGFESALFEQESLMDGHAVERVGYLAIYRPGDAGVVPTSSGDQLYSLGSGSLSHTWQQISAVALKLEEEQSADQETAHTAESIDYLTLGGLTFAQIVSFNGSDPVALRQYEVDTDSDGLVNLFDADDDGDGMADGVDSKPLDSDYRGAEQGTTSLGHDWSSVLLPSLFDNPVVIIGPPTYHDEAPGVARIRNVTSDGFEARFDLQFDEWDYQDGVHAAEDIPHLVLEQGVHHLPDGSVLEVGTFNLGGTKTWKAQNFQYAFNARPKLFLTLQTVNGWQTVTVRARSVTANGFQAALFEEDALNDGHAVEQVGYLAVYSPTGSGRMAVGGQDIPYLLQSEVVDHRFTPVLSGALKMEEEQSADAETLHAAEIIDILTLGDQLFAQDVTSDGMDTAALRRIAVEQTVAMEWGTVRNVSNNWMTVPLAKSYTNPVVVAKQAKAGDPEPGVIRIRNVTSDSFQIRFQEWNYLNGSHPATERVFYLVAEAGSTTLGGLQATAGTATITDLPAYVDLTGFAEPPALFTGVMSYAGGDTVTARISALSAAGFEVRLQEQQSKMDGHIAETVGWIAIQQGTGATSDGRKVEVISADANHLATVIDFAEFKARRFPVTVTSLSSFNGSDTATSAQQGLTSSKVEVFVREEQSLDAELLHAPESISVFVAE